ncbi:MAG: translesion error-prone DNA polymerase V autoproteolytic subunit [Paludibacteraceae bacterium]|jgi:DNA polymerase V|nr:translesion error-prone DNA polymerase V autoproteolytic subunit [Paludibacteraceae bacterium]
MASEVIVQEADWSTTSEQPYVDGGVRAGFPSPSQDYLEQTLDLNRFLVSHPESTFFAKVVGDSMIDVGIEEGDLLVIDRSIDPQDGHIVVAFLDGEFTLKFIRVDKQNSNQLYLVPANSDYPEILVTSEQQFVVWGVVTYSIKNRLKR